MDRDPPAGTKSKQFLRVDPARCHLQHAAVEPVILERCWISMSDSLSNPKSSNTLSSNQDSTSSNPHPDITSSAASSSSRTSTSSNAGRGVTSGPQQRASSDVRTESKTSTREATSTTKATCSAVVSPRTSMTMSTSSSHPSLLLTSTSPTQTSTTPSVGAASVPPASPVRLVELAQAQRQLADTPTTATTTALTMVAASSSGPGFAHGAASGAIPKSLVGGQRPLGEESPVIILTTARSDESNTRAQASKTISSSTGNGSDKPGPDRSPGRKRKTQQIAPLQELQKPEETIKLSTNIETQSSEKSREGTRREDKITIVPIVQFSEASPLPSPKRDENDVMQFFQEQEKSLQESFLSLPKHQQQQSQRKKRSTSPKVHQTAPGLEHLDNLVRLMEQLSSLKDENSRLRKRCDYLESTKVLLQAKRDLTLLESSDSSSKAISVPPKHKHRHHHHHHLLHRHHHEHEEEKDSHVSGENVSRYQRVRERPRLSSAEELGYLHIDDTSSDQRPKKAKSGLTKRSFSTGSLEIPSELLDQISGLEGGRKLKSKHIKAVGGKSKSKGSKWARVKKVLTGQKLYEELGTTIKTIRDLGRSASHVRYSTGGSSHDTSPPTSRIPGSVSGGTEHRLSPETAILHKDIRHGERPPLTSATSDPGEGVFKGDQESVDDSLTSEIWMGPPDWWEEYEASKESNASTSSDFGSVIEVTTMYLGVKKDHDDSEPPSPTNIPVASSATSEKAQEQYLSVEKSLPRRQSSPSLSMKETGEEDDLLDELAATSEPHPRILHKSSSCKSADLDIPKSPEYGPSSAGEGRHSKKSHRTAWGRVKDIIHTRKDSIKKRPRRDKSESRGGIESEETSEIDMEALLEEHLRSTESFGEGLLSRSTPKTSPVIIRQQSGKPDATESSSAPSQQPAASPSRLSLQGTSPGNVDLTALLAGSMSDEFTKKMQEWEQKKSRKSSVRVSADESDLDVSSVSQEFPLRTIDLRDYKGPVPDGVSEETTPQESHTSMEVLGAPNPSINVEEIQRRMTGSFSRKMQEWEKLKYRSQSVSAREPSPVMERKGSKGRKDDRQKSKRSRVDKEKEKMERQRERDMQKVEREQMKLEKEKLRIEKERLRALEREAKLEKLKGRLSQPDTEGSFKNPVLSPLAEYKVTADFARKLHEWELKKGLSHDVSNSIYLEAQKLSLQHLRQEQLSKSQDEEDGDQKQSPVAPLSIQSFWDSPLESSPVEKYSEMSLEDAEGDGDGEDEGDGDDETCTSMTEECLTKSNIVTLEHANQELLENLQRKELEYAAVQTEVQNVNEKLAKVREEHAKEMARFHRELALGSVTEPVKLEVGELETTMGQMEQKIKAMESFGERLALSMESAAVGKWSSVEGEETVHTQLVELVDQMREMLVQASQSEEKSQKTMALTNFETLYSQAMKLQVQMNNLRLSHLERNREIMVVKRQLLLQEVNNLLLQADITRRETELYQYHAAKRFASLRRWNTFSGSERGRPQAQIEIPPTKLVSERDSSKNIEAPRVNIPYIPEEVILASAASSSISAPASPSAIEAAGGSQSHLVIAASSQSHSSPGAARDVSADSSETHLLSPSSASRCGQILPSPANQRPGSQPRKKSEETAYVAIESSQAPPILRLPEPIVHLPPRTPKSEISPTTPTSPTSVSLAETSGSSEDIQGSSSTLVGVTSGSGLDESFTSETSSSGKPEFTTICDSAPLYKELRALRKEKSRVEKGTPTLIMRGGKGLSSVPSPGEGPRKKSTTGTPDQTIPRQQKQRESDTSRSPKTSATIDTDNSLAPTVMECTDPIHTVDQTPLTTDSAGASGGANISSHPAPIPDTTNRRDLPPTCDSPRAGSKSPRSPLTKHNYLRRQKEERDTKLKEYRAISPKGSPISARGKPPLPRQSTPVRHSPSASPATDKSPRSKSVGDMDRPVPPDSPSTKPLQEAINKFEKRATVCETEDRPLELRKTPSPTLHLPRVGLVSRVRKLKPAAELLEESQRYRSGQSIYATRILQRYLPKDEHRGGSALKTFHNKENTGTNEHTMVRRLSGESTPTLPSRTVDSPRSSSDIATHVATKLSSLSGPQSQNGASPFKDLTNNGKVKKMADTLNGQYGDSSPDRTLSESDIDKQLSGPSTSAKTQNRKSCEVAIVLSSSSALPTDSSYNLIYATASESGATQKPDSTIGPTNHQSLPTLMPQSSPESVSRGRAATYSASEPGRHPREMPQSGTESPSTSKGKASKSKLSSGKRSREKKEKEPGFRFPSSLSPVRRGAGRGKGGTVGVLCKQSISFDLGVSLYAQQSPSSDTPKSRQVKSWDPSESIKAEEAAAAVGAAASAAESDAELQLASSSGATATGGEPAKLTEGEMASSSTAGEEKKKPRRFLDSSWLQKSKKFFKVSK